MPTFLKTVEPECEIWWRGGHEGNIIR